MNHHRATPFMDPVAGRSRRGTVLIVTLFIILILASMVLVLCRSIRVETLASANHVAALQAAAIERGAEEYVLSLIEQQADAVLTLPEEYFCAIPVGQGYFWIIRPNYGDDSLPIYGLVDEASKINLNSASSERLASLPGMTPDIADAIVDWRDADSDISPEGAEDEYYLSLPQPHYCKNAPFETVEEVLLVRGMTRELLYGELGLQASQSVRNYSGGVLAAPGLQGSAASSIASDAQLARGLFDLITVYSVEPPQQQSGGGRNNPGGSGSQGQGPITGRININTAPFDVLMCLPGLDENDVNTILSRRATSAEDQSGLAWVNEVLQQKAAAIGDLITDRSYQFSADIVAVSGNGRAFKRCRIVVDARNMPAQIVYRKDLTERGWPLEPEVLIALRQGNGLPYLPGMMPGGDF